MSGRGVSGESLGDKLFRALDNPAQRFLAIGGFFIALAGAIFALWANGQAQSERSGNDLLVMLGGVEHFDPTAGDGFAAWANVGIAVVVVGVLMILSVIVIKAAQRPRP